MLHYPKIPGSRDCPGGRCLAFEKYDGTNLHWDWDRDIGWHALDPDGGPYLGAGGQFGGGHRGTNVLFVDGSVRHLDASVSPEVFEALGTIAGGEKVGRVGDE